MNSSDAMLSSSQIHVSPTFINGLVLLTGEAPKRTHIDRILDIAKGVLKKHEKCQPNRVGRQIDPRESSKRYLDHDGS
ncbi:MAG: hypothetical protein CM1200mP41_30550 [Gammaproteobacteria bacterium]|nr:MAG: hypothetical protein CM1200mP41_30550 [Gammaproteobacteria bacterium]